MSHAACWSVIILACISSSAWADPSVIQVGSGSYATSRPPGAKGPPEKIYATANVTGKMPTNDWWSSLAWMPFSERQYPHPLALQAEKAGLRIYYPGAMITANKAAIFGFMPDRGGDDVVLGHSAQGEFREALVDGFSDWFVSAKFARDGAEMTVSYGHGSPFVFARFKGGTPRLTFAKPPVIRSGDARSATLAVTVNGKHYGLFAPRGSTWTGLGGTTLTCQTKSDYFSLAILPDDREETLALFRRYAHAHIVDTRFTGSYDAATGAVTNEYRVTTKCLEGDAEGTLLALYPHQWRSTDARLLDKKSYTTVRGEMKFCEGASFQTRQTFPGVLPSLPRIGGCDESTMAKLLAREVDREEPVKDTYWEGKRLGKIATLIPIAEAYGQADLADAMRKSVRRRLEHWLTAVDERGRQKSAGLFSYDERWGTLIGYPASYGSDTELNDHHFHYGYFIRAAAEIARIDRDWAKRWGGMIDLLIRDIASADRRDPLFPHLRSFDPYAGHSWASGHAKFGDGNNNESSSEAMNAWYGMILWGEYTGNPSVRDLGIVLYTTEMTAINEYWFDVHDTNHPKAYTPSVVTMIWGGKGANGTWFSANPETVHGINWLPIHGGSLYLGHYQEYVRKNYEALVAENNHKPWDAWADLIWMYRALDDPSDAMRQFDSGQNKLPTEGGNSRANAYHWIGTLGRLGHVQPAVSANVPLFAVFDQGKTRTYVVDDAGAAKEAAFSDGFKFAPAPGVNVKTRQLP